MFSSTRSNGAASGTVKIVSMIREYHNHKPQTNPWLREEEPHNHHKTPGRQTKESNQLSLPHQDDYKTRIVKPRKFKLPLFEILPDSKFIWDTLDSEKMTYS